MSLDVTNREQLLKSLLENRTDLVIMGQPPAEMDLAAERFMDNPLVVIAPPDHPLVACEHIPLERLPEENSWCVNRVPEPAPRWNVFLRRTSWRCPLRWK